jgi:hypothetical protein
VIVATDWVTVSALATAGGTLVLAGATYMSVRSANRAARVAERTLLAGLRPLLVPSRLDDATQKIFFADQKYVRVDGARAAFEIDDDAILMVISLRNAGAGVALLHGWRFYPERLLGADETRPDLESFTRLTRDIYVPARDVGFWQGAFRDPAAPEFATAKAAIEGGSPLTVDILYGDHEGGQRTITRFGLLPHSDGVWLAAAGRYWNVDRDDPRPTPSAAP